MALGISTTSRHPRGRLCALLAGVAVLLSACFCCRAAHAFDITPFRTRNQSPLVQIYGLPAAGSAEISPRGRGELYALLDQASYSMDHENTEEFIVLDGETTRLTLGGRYGIAGNLEVGVEIPYLHHGGGFLDGFLIDYHDLFGIAQGGRDRAPRNRLLYLYRRHGTELLRMDRSGGGLGDMALTAGWQLYHDGGPHPRAVALRAALKLPTGETAFLRGSGSTDLSLWLSAVEAFALPLGQGALFGGAGLMVMTEGKILPDQQANQVVFGTLGAGWKPREWLAFKVQFDAHTPFYRGSDFQPLSDPAVVVQIGGTLGLTEKTSLDIAVSEDVARRTAPDVAVHFNLAMRF